jgi:hypothetical protein
LPYYIDQRSNIGFGLSNYTNSRHGLSGVLHSAAAHSSGGLRASRVRRGLDRPTVAHFGWDRNIEKDRCLSPTLEVEVPHVYVAGSSSGSKLTILVFGLRLLSPVLKLTAYLLYRKLQQCPENLSALRKGSL